MRESDPYTSESDTQAIAHARGYLAQFAGVGKKIEWDVEKMQCTNLPEINQYVRRTYRKGWEVKGLS